VSKKKDVYHPSKGTTLPGIDHPKAILSEVLQESFCRVLLLAFLVISVSESLAQSNPGIECWITTEDLTCKMNPQPPLEFSKSLPVKTDIRIDEQKTYQTILGLGSSLEHTTCANLWRLDAVTRNEVMERLISPQNGIGMSTMRICIGSPDFTGEPWYTYDDMPPGEKDNTLDHFSIEKDRAYILPILKIALAKNPQMVFFASPWSPPGWMKTCDDLIGGHLLPEYYHVYAEYFVKFIKSYESEGIPIHAITVQNEPGVNKRDDVRSWWYPSCQWSLVMDEDTWWPVPTDIMGHAERDFVRDHLGPVFREQGIETRIWCYDHNFNNLWYPRAILTDKKAAEYVEGTAFHPYAGNPSAMGAFHEEFPGKKVFLSEGSTTGVEGALQIIEFLQNWASTYNAWVTIIDSEGKPNNGPFETTQTCVTIDAKTLVVSYHYDYYMYGQFMKFIRPSAIRLESGESNPEFAHVAFRNQDDSIVLVVVNPRPKTRRLEVVWNNMSFTAVLNERCVATYRWHHL
jgi:glucosylceramidase